MNPPRLVWTLILVGGLAFGLLPREATAAELASAAVFAVAEIEFVGPVQDPTDTPARDVQLEVTFRHESGSPDIKVQGFFDGDGAGRQSKAMCSKCAFCPTQPGKWTLVEVASNATELAGQHHGDHVIATSVETARLLGRGRRERGGVGTDARTARIPTSSATHTTRF